MKKNSFFLNKYTISLLIVLLCLGIDVWVHKGMSRVLIPESFTDKRSASGAQPCRQILSTSDKYWVKGVNNPELALQLNDDVPGFETDVYFDKQKNIFYAYHDSTNISNIHLRQVLDVYRQRHLSGGVWLDFKNLEPQNQQQALANLLELRRQFSLDKKMIIESSCAECLPAFCEQGFFTSYYTPNVNPYTASERDMLGYIDSIASKLSRYKVSALSGYYFQYPVLKKYFPRFPILTWVDKSKLSIVANTFHQVLAKDSSVKVVLTPL